MSSPEKKKKFPVGIVETLWDLNLELAYLHPNYFSPDLSVLELLGVKKGEKYAILRFVKWNANHDLGHTGITPRTRLRQFRSLRNMPGFLFLVSLSCLQS